MPLPTGSASMSFLQASSPPAEAPIPTIRKSSRPRGGPRTGTAQSVNRACAALSRDGRLLGILHSFSGNAPRRRKDAMDHHRFPALATRAALMRNRMARVGVVLRSFRACPWRSHSGYEEVMEPRADHQPLARVIGTVRVSCRIWRPGTPNSEIRPCNRHTTRAALIARYGSSNPTSS